MQKQQWYSIFPNNPWLSIYTWVIFCLLPFFFIFRFSSFWEVTISLVLLLLFFLCYRFSFRSKSGTVYMWLSFEMVINIVMTLFFGFVYFALFTAFFIGNIRHTAGFFIMYGLHIATTLGAVIGGAFLNIDLFLPQWYFILIALIGTVLLPFHLYHRNRNVNLEGQLEVAKERINELIVFEERQRIARDLHDTLGQKLSLIGLKSDLANRVITLDPDRAQREIQDIRKTASTALKEVRELVSDMRFKKIATEIVRAKQMLTAAEIKVQIVGNPVFSPLPPITENVLSMCLKEAVTNVVKHSGADTCQIAFEKTHACYTITVTDNGKGFSQNEGNELGSGLLGMQERLEFVNGRLTVAECNGTILSIYVPVVQKEGGNEK